MNSRTLVVYEIKGAGRTFKVNIPLELKKASSIALFSPCKDHLELTRNEREGKEAPDTTKLYGFDWMRENYKDIYGYYWNSVSFKEVGDKKVPVNKKIPMQPFSKLQGEYEQIPNAYNTEEKYYVPWLSLQAKATARINLTFRNNFKPTDVSLLYDDTLFEITHEKISGKTITEDKKRYKLKDVKIINKQPFNDVQKIQVKINGIIVGQLNVLPNATQRKVKIGWCLVELKGNDRDKVTLEKEVKYKDLKGMLSHLGLSQAQFDVTVVKEPHILELRQSYPLNEYLLKANVCTTIIQANEAIINGHVMVNGMQLSKEKYVSKKIKTTDIVHYKGKIVSATKVFSFFKTDYTTPNDFTYVKPETGRGNENTIIEKEAFKNAIFNQYRKQIQENNGYDIVLVFVNEQAANVTKDVVNKKIQEKAMVKGEAEKLNGKYVMIYNRFDKNTLIHEVLHCMTLLHSFGSIREHSFKALQTKNIMDYYLEKDSKSDTRKSIWKWQIEKLWKWYDKAHQNK